MSENNEAWLFDEIGHRNGCPRVTDSDGHPICDLRGWGHLTGTGGLALPRDEAMRVQEERGRLIAAAPNLLRALDEAPILRSVTGLPRAEAIEVLSAWACAYLLWEEDTRAKVLAQVAGR